LTAVAPAIFLAAASTVLGFGSLMASAYAPLRTLGLVTALTVSTTLIAALVVMPAVVGQDT
jgi:predicted RND superfamily exporter protein